MQANLCYTIFNQFKRKIEKWLLAFGSEIFLTDLFLTNRFPQKSQSFLFCHAVLNVSGDKSYNAVQCHSCFCQNLGDMPCRIAVIKLKRFFLSSKSADPRSGQAGPRTKDKDLDLGNTLNLVCHSPPPTHHHPLTRDSGWVTLRMSFETWNFFSQG